MTMTTEYFNSLNSLCSNSFDPCERRRILSGDFKNIDCDNESIMEYTAETSTKASSSSIQESITNMSNSHSTPEDNFSENALSSPFSKLIKSDCDKDFEPSSNHYSRNQHPNGIYKSLSAASNNSKSIDDTIESVLSKIREENDAGFIKSSTLVLGSSEPSANSSMSMPASVQNITQDYDNLHYSKSFPAVSYHNSNTQHIRADSGLFPANYSVSNFNKSHPQQFYNYGNYYSVPNSFNNQISLPNYNRQSYGKDSDKSSLFQYQNPTYRPYMANSFVTQPYYRPEPSNIAVQQNYQLFQKPIKRDSAGYDHILEHELGINFKTPQPNSSSLFDQNVRKKRSGTESNKATPTKRRKLINQLSNNSSCDDLINKLKLTNHNALLMNPLLPTNKSLLPPIEFAESTKIQTIKYQKYKSSPYFIVKPKWFKNQSQSDKFLSNFVPESVTGKVLLSDRNNDEESLSDIVCQSPYNEWYLLGHVNDVNNCATRDCVSPQLSTRSSDTPLITDIHHHPQQQQRSFTDYHHCINQRSHLTTTSIIAYTDTDAKLVIPTQPLPSGHVSDSKTYTQLSGSFLKRTKINGKSFSNVHIEEAVSVASLMASRPPVTCRHCFMSLVSLTSLKRYRTQSGTADQGEEYLFCSTACYSNFLADTNNPQQLSPQITIKTAPYKPPKNYKKVCDFEQYVRRRFPSEGQVNEGVTKPAAPSSSLLLSSESTSKPWLGVNYSYYKKETMTPLYNEMNRDDQIALLQQYSCGYRHGPLIDSRECVLCHGVGDGDESVCGRLMNIDSGTWVHLNCGLWCFEVFETVSGSLMGVQSAVDKAMKTECALCYGLGAGIQCYRNKCVAVYHVPCAYKTGCVFYTDRGMYCPAHAVLNHPMVMSSLHVDRRVNVWRDECALVADLVMDESDTVHCTLRTGTLILHTVGQLLPDQLASGHYNSSAIIYPIGYHATRIYWSSTTVNYRAKYECHIDEHLIDHRPLFRIICTDDDTVVTDLCCDRAWKTILNRVAERRFNAGLTRLFPAFLSGEQLYGLTEPHVVRVIESLPGVEILTNYAFKFGKMQLITEMPLAVNPTGSARTEPKLRTYVRRARSNHASGTCGILKTKCVREAAAAAAAAAMAVAVSMVSVVGAGNNSRTQQYKRLRSDWFNNVILSRSRIQGLGLLAARDLERSTMIIEYIGETIRNEVGNRREKLYQSRNNSIYMFRLSDDVIIDATVHGGLARYINHSCQPNCVAEFVSLDCGGRIVISTKQSIERGDELTYDYKFDLEDDGAEKIPCLCGSINCRRWMN